MSNLTLKAIREREGRVETLLNKLAKSSPFVLVPNGKFKADHLLVYFANGDITAYYPKTQGDFTKAADLLRGKGALKAIDFSIANETKSYPLTKLQKTGEFGGKPGGTLIKEDKALKQLRESLYAAIKENGGPLTVSAGGSHGKVRNVVDIRPTEHTKVKSDFELINTSGEPVYWISHKDGATVKDFQQWSGVSKREEPILFRHPEVEEFTADLLKAKPKGLFSGETYWRIIEDNRLKMMAVYGNQFGASLGEQNVTVTIQGEPRMQNKGSYWEVNSGTLPDHRHYNGAPLDRSMYEPVLLGFYNPGRNNGGILHCRLGIWPIKSRGGNINELPSLKR